MKNSHVPRTRGVQVSLLILLGISVIAVASDAFRYSVYASIASGTGTSTSADVAEAIASAVSVAYLAALLAVIIALMTWVYRMNAYLRKTSDYPIRSTPGWAVGWYFIPIACLFRPLRDMRDLWQASHNSSGKGLGLVNCWWASFLVCEAAWLVAPAPELTSASAYMLDSASYLLTDTLGILPCTLTLIVVLRIASAATLNTSDTNSRRFHTD